MQTCTFNQAHVQMVQMTAYLLVIPSLFHIENVVMEFKTLVP